jgi:DNA-binding NtrC family response regulator
MPETLIDAELFGNCKNYPNPGMADRQGLVGEAAHSTLFLDEIAELPHGSQAHLLRLLDRGEYHRLGESKARQSDLRLVAATNRDPSALKHDLLARMTLRVSVPVLNERLGDVPLLVRHILRRAAARGDAIARARVEGGGGAHEPYIDIGFMRQLVAHRYRLGVRELETLLWRHLTNPSTSAFAVDDLTPTREDGAPSHDAQASADVADFAATDIAAARIQRCLDDNNGVVELTWRALGMKNRYVLIRAIKKYGLEVRRRPGQGPLRAVR